MRRQVTVTDNKKWLTKFRSKITKKSRNAKSRTKKDVKKTTDLLSTIDDKQKRTKSIKFHCELHLIEPILILIIRAIFRQSKSTVSSKTTLDMKKILLKWINNLNYQRKICSNQVMMLNSENATKESASIKTINFPTKPRHNNKLIEQERMY